MVVQMPMAEPKQKLYEAMFLISQGVAADLSGAVAHLEEILARGNATIVAMKKWDERRLAYEIDKQKRGVYILVYFTAAGEGVSHIERDCNLSESVMRVLVVRADHMTVEEAQAMDDRDGLAAEAKMRGERGAATETRRSSARLGAPEPAQKPEDEAGDDAADGAAEGGETGEAAAEPAAEAGADEAAEKPAAE